MKTKYKRSIDAQDYSSVCVTAGSIFVCRV